MYFKILLVFFSTLLYQSSIAKPPVKKSFFSSEKKASFYPLTSSYRSLDKKRTKWNTHTIQKKMKKTWKGIFYLTVGTITLFLFFYMYRNNKIENENNDENVLDDRPNENNLSENKPRFGVRKSLLKKSFAQARAELRQLKGAGVEPFDNMDIEQMTHEEILEITETEGTKKLLDDLDNKSVTKVFGPDSNAVTNEAIEESKVMEREFKELVSTCPVCQTVIKNSNETKSNDRIKKDYGENELKEDFGNDVRDIDTVRLSCGCETRYHYSCAIDQLFHYRRCAMKCSPYNPKILSMNEFGNWSDDRERILQVRRDHELLEQQRNQNS